MFMIGAIFSLDTEIDKSDRIPIEVTIVLINSRRNESYNMYYHDVFVGYTVDGKTYKSELDAYSSDFYEGMKIDIVYDKNDPSKYLMNTDKIAYLANTYRPDNEDTYIEFGVIPDKDFNNNEININPINDNPIDTGIKILNNNNDVIKYK